MQAEELRYILEQHGISCWMGNRNIPGGKRFTDEITKAIEGCQVFLLILSRKAQDSVWVYRELEYSINQRKIIIPYIIEEFELNSSFHFMLSSHNGINAYDHEDDPTKELLTRILEILGPNSRSRATTQEFNAIHCPQCQSARISNCLSNIEIWKIRLGGFGEKLIIATFIVGLCDVVAMVVFSIGRSLFDLATGKTYPVGQCIPLLPVEKCMVFILAACIAITVMLVIFACIDILIQHIIEKRNKAKHITVQTYRCNNCNSMFSVKVVLPK